MEVVKAKCIKETYTWDGKQHKFPYVKMGLYMYLMLKYVLLMKKYIGWTKVCCLIHMILNLLITVKGGLEEKNFKEMFEIQ